MNEKVDKYLTRAEYCKHKALTNTSEIEKAMWLEIAAEWQRLAKTFKKAGEEVAASD